MKKNSRTRTLLMLVAMCISAYITNAQTADLILIDFDDNMPYREFIYAGPDNDKPSIDSDIYTTNINFIQEGTASRYLEWNDLNMNQYFGWGIELPKFNANKVKTLSFWVIGTSGGERMEIKIKSSNGIEPVIISSQIKPITKEWQKITVPIEKFTGLNSSSVINVNLGFNKVTSGKSGRIYIDNFRFEYE